MLDEQRARQPERDIQLELATEQTGWWDGNRLAQALSNIVANALQHGDPDAPISIRVVGEADSARVEIHNFGAVIPEELQLRIFEPYERAKGSTGLGLGLFIAREIVRAHGGDVTFSSSPDRGTTFRIELPKTAGIADPVLALPC